MKTKDNKQRELALGKTAKPDKVEIKVPEVKISYKTGKTMYQDKRIRDSQDIADFVRKQFIRGEFELQEQVFVLFLNQANKIIGYYKHSKGSHISAIVDTKIIIAAAIKSLSSSIILVHNHPSGSVEPGRQDIAITDKLIDLLKQFDILVLDHIILTMNDYYSFVDNGQISGLLGITNNVTHVDLYEGIPVLTKEDEKELGIEEDNNLGKLKGRDAIYKMVNDKILAMIKSSDELFWRKTWIDAEVADEENTKVTNREFGRSFSTGRLYSGINFWAVNVGTGKDENGEQYFYLKKSSEPYWLTTKQIRENGGKIKKDAKKAVIVYYIEHYSLFGNGISQSEYWKIRRACNKNPNDKRCEGLHSYRAMKFYFVYNQKDVTGIDFKKKAPKVKFRKPLNQDEKILASELVIKHMPNPPKINYGGARAFYQPATDNVQMPKQGQFESINEFYGTQFHELSHATGHKSRLDRKFGLKGTKEYAYEELVAELSASYLNAESGILFSTLRNSSAYIKGWNKRLIKEMETDYKFFFKASADAQKASNYILNLDENGEPEFYKHLNNQGVKGRIKVKAVKLTEKENKAHRLKLRAEAIKLKLTNY